MKLIPNQNFKPKLSVEESVNKALEGRMSDKNAITFVVRLAKQVAGLTVEERTFFEVILQLCDLMRQDPETVTKMMEEFVQKHQYEDPYKDKMYEHD